MNDREELIRLLLEGCNMLELELKESQVNNFLQYLRLVQEWNEKINLTAIVNSNEFIVKHFLDSLTGTQHLDGRGKLVDVGSGAGLPGLALKIYFPEMEVCLVESVGKKAQFLETAAKDLGLQNVNVVCARAEDVGRDGAFREAFDYAVCRAVSELAVIAEYCLPLVKIGGILLAYKGDKADEELSRAGMAISTLKGEVDGIYKVTLPLLGDNRTLIRIKKTGTCPEKFPRRPGIPVKRPLK